MTKQEKKNLKNGFLNLCGRIDEDMFGYFMECFDYLESKNSPDIEIRIFSRGGAHQLTLSMISRMNEYDGKITGKVILKAFSSAFVLLQACDYRTAESHAELLMHKVQSSEEFLYRTRPTSDFYQSILKADKDVVKTFQEEGSRLGVVDKSIANFFAKKSVMKSKDILDLLKKDEIKTSHEMLNLGFLDEVKDSIWISWLNSWLLSRVPSCKKYKKAYNKKYKGSWREVFFTNNNIY